MLNRLERIRQNYIAPFGPKGLALAVGSRLGVGSVTVTPKAIGSPVTFRTGTSDWACYRQVIVSHEYDFPYPATARTIIDAGAYVGFSAIYFAKKYPDAVILAIEPDAENFALLQRNTRAFPQITTIHAAVWGETKQLSVVDAGGREWGFQTVDTTPPRRRSPVPALAMATLLETYGIERVDILKVDIEGAERQVFARADGWIDRVGSIVIELHDRFAPGCSEVVRSAVRSFDVCSQRGDSTFFGRTLGSRGAVKILA
jgi:FkbM family methyltransferase